ncbi:hypothetical protein [Clostridium gasigenes]|uniref:Uncharacterized protein n=1 Tax=Clostridium gasigenes TaxID=94869 RepID=A0A7X0VSM8_9CLOT|nr:hypothetical protein [Clostridium gasigenes]MBB6716642.1 hypothetical protein [Clostridium gasigenes]
MSKREIKRKIEKCESAVREIKAAITLEYSAIDNLGYSKKRVSNAIGGQGGKNIINSLDKLINESIAVNENLNNSIRSINNEINTLQNEYDKEEK